MLEELESHWWLGELGNLPCHLPHWRHLRGAHVMPQGWRGRFQSCSSNCLAWQFCGSKTLSRFGNSIAAFEFLHFAVCWVGVAFCGVSGFAFLAALLVSHPPDAMEFAKIPACS